MKKETSNRVRLIALLTLVAGAASKVALRGVVIWLFEQF